MHLSHTSMSRHRSGWRYGWSHAAFFVWYHHKYNISRFVCFLFFQQQFQWQSSCEHKDLYRNIQDMFHIQSHMGRRSQPVLPPRLIHECLVVGIWLLPEKNKNRKLHFDLISYLQNVSESKIYLASYLRISTVHEGNVKLSVRMCSVLTKGQPDDEKEHISHWDLDLILSRLLFSLASYSFSCPSLTLWPIQ